jgi:dTDP-4-dehydrorhamnose 3,5-epimerase
MKFTPTNIPDVLLIDLEVFGDERGFFMETYQAEKFAVAGISYTFIQDNHSRSRQGTLRGLHYQIRRPQGKLLRVVAGEVFDVAVDIRRKSPTFGQWVGVTLSAERRQQMWVPPGFAHGFYVLSEWAELVYKATDLYAPAWERTIMWNDPQIRIDWPLHPEKEPIISKKDAQGIKLEEADLFI